MKLALEQKLKKELSEKSLEVQIQERGVVITVSNKILFDPGQAFIKSRAKESLNKIAKVIKEICPNNLIRVEGHTDNKPIRYSRRYPSNWELSADRAVQVVRYLIKQGISPYQLSAVGYGEYHPIASNDTTYGRAKNRRVEIVITPQIISAGENLEREEK